MEDAALLIGDLEVDVVESQKDTSKIDLPAPAKDSLLVRYWKDSDSQRESELLFFATVLESSGGWIRGDCVVASGCSYAIVDLLKSGNVYANFAPEVRRLKLWLTDKAVEDGEGLNPEGSDGSKNLAKLFSGLQPNGSRDLDLSWFYRSIRRLPTDTDLPRERSLRIGGLRPSLRSYQKRAVNFMLGREDPDVEGEAEELHPLWQQYVGRHGRPIYVNSLVGRASLRRPRGVLGSRGGILADEMGLGKTVEILCLVLTNPRVLSAEQSLKGEQTSASDEACCKICHSTELEDTDKDFFYEYAVACSWIQCDECKQWLHALCGGIYERTTLEALREDAYLCNGCASRAEAGGEKYEGRASLIIVPAALLRQWEEEVEKHALPGCVKTVTYEGLRSARYIAARELAEADIVLTTYDALRADFNHSDPSTRARTLRREKKYRTIPTPLMMVNWWRVCLDEAQMVESESAVATQMALRLSSQIRWCVTGTPARNQLRQIQGLVQFVGIRPFSDPFWWKRALLQQSEEDVKAYFRSFVWRTRKDDVAEELGLPPQESKFTKLHFSPAEAYFYRRQHEACRVTAERVLKNLPAGLLLNGINGGGLLRKLEMLRQACCHPQVGGSGLRSLSKQQNSEAMTMGEVVDALIRRAKIECEDAQRLFIAASNGVASCCLLTGGRDLAQAVNLYRESLRIAEENSVYFEMDRMQKMHIFHNYAEALDLIDLELKKPRLNDDTASVLKKIGRTLRDSELRDQTKLMQNEYVAEVKAKLAVSQAEFEKTRHDVEDIAAKNKGEMIWWATAIREVDLDAGLSAQLPQRIQTELLDTYHGRKNQRSLSSSVTSTAGLKFVLDRELTAMNKKRKELLDQLLSLPGSKPPTAEDVAISGNCKKCRPDRNGDVCEHCESEKFFSAYEKALFYVREKNINSVMQSTSRDGVVAHGEGGVRLQGEVEKILRILLTFLRRTYRDQMLVEATCKDAQKFFEYLEALKREFTQFHLLFRAQKDLLSALDELDMAIMRITIRSPEDEAVGVEKLYKVLPEEVPVANVSYSNDRMAEESNLKRKRGQLTYLESLRNEGNTETKPEAKNKTCAICLGEMTDEFSVFPCGHFFCFECTARVVERASGVENVPGAFSSVRCPSCRARAALAEISYVHPQQERERLLQNEQREIKGSFGSKIGAVVRSILTILDADRSQKLLIFSQWTDVLEIVSSSLRENGVGFARTEKGKKSFQAALHRFRTEPKISALLLPIKSCASGLNIVEATHVVLVEPQMNPAAEAQAVGRVHRIGQTQKTTVHHFIVENTIEEKIVDIERQRAQSYHGVLAKNPTIERITTADVSLMFHEAVHEDGS
uniref:Uncharacterized protein n=1 Tax=Rhodosorus marinus TaxID=101924 RepID=A0A7S2ZTF8_9RHOD